MIFKVKVLGLEAKRPIVFLHKEDAKELNVRPLDRVEIKVNEKKVVAIVNLTDSFVNEGEVGIYQTVARDLSISGSCTVNIHVASSPESIDHIKSKLSGIPLKKEEIDEIVKDVVEHRLSEIEI